MGIGFFVPIYVLFLQENGLSLLQVMVLEALYAIGVIMLEIPTGFFADVHGRKKSILIATTSLLIGIAIYSVGNCFIHFFIANLFWAAGMAFASGADSALIYDTLLNLKRRSDYKKIIGNAFFIQACVMFLASTAGGFIATISFRATFYAMLPFSAIVPLVALTLKEPKRKKLIIEKGYVHKMSEIIRFSFKKEEVRWLIIYPALILGFDSIVYLFAQPYFIKTGFSVIHLGFLFAAMPLVAGIAAKYAYLIEGRIGRRNSLLILPIITSASLLIMGVFTSYVNVVFFLAICFVMGYTVPVISDYINRVVSSDKRATVVSIASMMKSLFYAALAPFLGHFADLYSLEYAFILSGIIVAVGCGALLIFLKKDKVI